MIEVVLGERVRTDMSGGPLPLAQNVFPTDDTRVKVTKRSCLDHIFFDYLFFFFFFHLSFSVFFNVANLFFSLS